MPRDFAKVFQYGLSPRCGVGIGQSDLPPFEVGRYANAIPLECRLQEMPHIPKTKPIRNLWNEDQHNPMFGGQLLLPSIISPPLMQVLESQRIRGMYREVLLTLVLEGQAQLGGVAIELHLVPCFIDEPSRSCLGKGLTQELLEEGAADALAKPR
jgi:hypothetical protein